MTAPSRHIETAAIVVTWTRIPIIGLPELACGVPVTDDGRACDADGEPLPLDDRSRVCGKNGTWMLGAVCLCAEHFPEVARLAGDSAEEIEAAWREECL